MVELILRPRDAARGAQEGAETFPRLAGVVATEILDRKLGLVHVPDLLDPAAARVPMDGCIVAFPYADDAVVAELRRHEVPVVLAEPDPAGPPSPWTVALDHRPVVGQLLDRLSEQGARRITLASGTEDNAWNRDCRDAYLAWAAQHGMAPRTRRVYEGLGVRGGFEFAERELAGPDRPDAIVVATGRMAEGVLAAAEAAGVAVPDDLLLAGLTDSVRSRASIPAITSVDLEIERFGRAAVELLMALLDGAPPPSEPVLVAPTLHWRASTQRS